ncbi:MAG: hypothetical protein JSS87_03270 [Acidobacteria bacterium]|nr:hypothetical protein [Acidobacteriota bacterium]
MEEASQTPKLSPDETLAGTVVESIKAAKLLSDQKLAGLPNRLAGGSLTAADWKLLAELALPTGVGGKS